MGKSKHRHRVSSWFKSWVHPSSEVAEQEHKHAETRNETANENDLNQKSEDTSSKCSAQGQRHQEIPSPEASFAIQEHGLTTQAANEKSVVLEQSQEDRTAVPAARGKSVLWDRAYAKLRDDDHKLVVEFEDILGEQSHATVLSHNAEANTDAQSATATDRIAQIDRVISLKLEEFKRRGSLVQGLSDAAAVAEKVSSFVQTAVSASPEASIAWAGVCLCLGVLTGPSQADTAVRSGLSHVTSRLQYYSALELELVELPPSDQESSKESIVELYFSVLEFQLRCVRRFYRSGFINFTRDVVVRDDWSGMVTSIKEKEDKIRADARYAGFFQLLSNSNDLGKQISDMEKDLASLLGVAEAQLAAIQEQKDLVAQQLKLMLGEHESGCLSAFKQTDYEGYKFSVPKKIDGTCEWFKTHPLFQEWVQGNSNFLLVSADPGCGKSVLAKHLIDSVLPETGAQICYFFFKDGHEDSTTLDKALCGLLHQLFSVNRRLMRHAIKTYADNQDKLVKSSSMLWDILLAAGTDEEAGNVICVLDALDECRSIDLAMLEGLLKQYFERVGKESRLRFLFTSRPYDSITSAFKIEGGLRIPGEREDESGQISREITLVIKERIKDLKLDGKLEHHLEDALLKVQNRTYLWVHLVFDDLSPRPGENKARFKRTEKGINSALEQLPLTVMDAYEKILSRVPKDKKKQLRDALCLILAAKRPLTVSEMNVALEVLALSDGSDENDGIDPEPDAEFAQSLQILGGLFISIIGGKIYLIHQTARVFLVQKHLEEPCPLDDPGFKWKESIREKDAVYTMADATCKYIRDVAQTRKSFLTSDDSERPAFQAYALQYWFRHSYECANRFRRDIDPLIDWVSSRIPKDELRSITVNQRPHALRNIF